MIEVTFSGSSYVGLVSSPDGVFSNSRVYPLPLGLSLGTINTDLCGREREQFLQSMICIRDPDFSGTARDELDTARESMTQILRGAVNGETIRLWYSHNPDEMCGFYHILSILPPGTDIRGIRMPEYTELGNVISTCTSWGDIMPGKFANYLIFEEKLSENAHRMYRSRWKQLVKENAPIRAVINGRLVSAGEELYDFYILRELNAREDVFLEAFLIGDILGKYQLGVSDWFLHRRIRHFESLGMLEAVDQAEVSLPGYHRYLRKKNI